LQVVDFGDLPKITYSPDYKDPKRQNLAQVREVAKRVAREVSRAIESNAKPIVLGGDCTVTLGVLAGFLNYERKLGLVYFDGDADLNTPETTLSGIYDGMVMAHILGKGSEELIQIGPRFPLMDEKDVVMFGYNLDAGWIDPFELQSLSRINVTKFSSAIVRENAKVAAERAIEHLDPGLNSVVVHFDLDVIDLADFAAVDVPHRNGLSYSETMAALNVFISTPAFGALMITEFNANRDQHGECAARLVESLGKVFEDAHKKWKP
jgi:arginase